MLKPFEALVLSVQEISESDLWIQFISGEKGRFAAVAKGARRSRRRFVNKLEPGHLLRVYLRPPRRGLAPILEAADLLWAPETLRTHPRAFVLASYFLELCERSSPPAEGREIFPLLREALETLDRTPEIPGLKAYFEYRLLTLLGWAPEMEVCLVCERTLAERVYFSFRRGGAVCAECAREEDQPLSGPVRGLLRSWRRLSPEALSRVVLSRDLWREAEKLLENFLLRVLDQDIKTLKVWREFRE
ncbi:DNA repair protein RecO [Thermosulfurimonas sp.]|uniref:DNA repair protein RecO n=1 Tax=Thermosulfurimonas sp. TaxID=2080236 RepID=UPI0025F8FC82|nr:DNA repair protein RecO [Thermosulfurimonas sp.]